MSEKRVLRNFINGEYVDPVDGGYADLIDPIHRRGVRLVAGLRAGRRGRGHDAPRPPRSSVARHHSRGAPAGPAQVRRRDRGARRGTGRRRGAQHRQAARLTPSEEMPPAVDQFRFFAGAARVLEGRSAGEYMAGHTSYVRREPIGVCAPGHAVELPADDGGLEVRAGHRRGQHRGAQAVRHHAGVHPAARRDRGRVPARRACSMWSAATGTPAARSSPTRPRRSSRSPARPAPARRSPRPPARIICTSSVIRASFSSVGSTNPWTQT